MTKKVVVTFVIGMMIILDTFANIGRYHRMHDVQFVTVSIEVVPVTHYDYVGHVDPPIRD